jgi:rhodanese-related sulfurtransferase
VRVIDLRPHELLERRSTLIVDIRAEHERDSELGWIPGARWMPEPIDPAGLVNLDGRLPVFACLSGRRSAELAAKMVGQLPQVGNLLGGLLGWGAAGLAVCHRPAPSGAPPRDMDDLRRQLRSCFMVEAVESGPLDDEQRAQRALSVVRRAFPEDRLLPRRELERRIDQLAETAWSHGHRVESIQRNTEHFYAVVAAL